MGMDILFTARVKMDNEFASFRNFDALNNWINDNVAEYTPPSYVEIEKAHFERLLETLKMLNEENCMELFPTFCRKEHEMLHYWESVNQLKKFVSWLLAYHSFERVSIMYSMSC